MPKCEIRWCQKEVDELTYVTENIGDGSWLVGICKDCASKLGMENGGDLPHPDVVRRLIKVKVK